MINLPRMLAPTNWGDFYGHEEEKHLVLRSITSDGLLFPNAFYVSGETGAGKTTLVNLIIKSLLCEAPNDYQLGDRLYKSVDPCGQCDNCKRIKDFRNAESSYTNIKLVQHGKADGDSVNTAVNEALRLSMVPPVDFNASRKDYRFLIFDEWQMFDKNQQQRVLLKAEDALPTSIFIFVTMAEEELGQRRRVALVSRGIDVDLKGFTEEDIKDYLLTQVNPQLPSDFPRVDSGVAKAIAEQCRGSLRMALSLYGKLFRYDYGLDYLQPATAKYFLRYTDAAERLELWRAINQYNWGVFDECVARFSQVYNPSQLDRLALDLVQDITTAMKSGKGDRDAQLFALNMLYRFVSNYKGYRIGDFLITLGGLNLGVV